MTGYTHEGRDQRLLSLIFFFSTTCTQERVYRSPKPIIISTPFDIMHGTVYIRYIGVNIPTYMYIVFGFRRTISVFKRLYVITIHRLPSELFTLELIGKVQWCAYVCIAQETGKCLCLSLRDHMYVFLFGVSIRGDVTQNVFN